MKILLIGYGKMGRIIEKMAVERGHQITGRIDVDNQHEWDQVAADVAIEFSHPDAAFDNLKACLLRGIPVVCGTTGWLARKPEIEQLCAHNDGAFFYASNYSLGVNIFFAINRYLARIMNDFNGYEVTVDETHHVHKKDAPSGTAITLAEDILAALDRKDQWKLNGTGDPHELAIRAHRHDEVPGTHVVTYRSVVDDIELKHTAHTREGFALGAIMVAEWLPGKKGSLSMKDFLKF